MHREHTTRRTASASAPRARTGEAQTAAILFVVAFGLFGLAWAGGNPAAASPDEGAHFVKAYATLDGQLSGEPFQADPTIVNPRISSWFAVSGRSYRMPARLVPPPSARCYSSDPDRTADCQDWRSPTGDLGAEVLTNTHVGTYSPFPYVVTGLAMQGADDFRSAARRGRLASLIVCTIFVGWAAVLARRRGALALAGLVLAAMPAVVFLSASLNTSGIEITSAMCFWSALLVLAREPGRGPAVAWGAVGVAGAALALTRPLGAIILPVVIATVVVHTGAAPLWTAVRRASWRARGCILLMAVACGVSFLWMSLAIPHPPIDLDLAARSLGAALRDLPVQARDIIGVFGWNDTTMPLAAYILGLLLLGVVGLVALALGTVRERVALVGLGLAAVALDLALAVLVEAQIGFGMQARYVMPLAVGLPLLAGDIVQMHVSRLRESAVRVLLAAVYYGAAVLHLTAFVANQHRYAVGATGSWLPPWDSRWSPDGGLALWLTLATVACGVLVSAANLVSRRTVLSPS